MAGHAGRRSVTRRGAGAAPLRGVMIVGFALIELQLCQWIICADSNLYNFSKKLDFKYNTPLSYLLRNYSLKCSTSICHH